MKYDVVIIGAGAAGLSAARALSGSRICILEARSRVGGRIHSLHVPDLPLPVELGAEFVHGQSPATFSIIDAAALPVAQLPDSHFWSRDGSWELVDDFWEQLDGIRSKIPRRKRDLSFDDFLRGQRGLTPRQRELARSFVEGYHAAHADRISALAQRTADGEQDQDDPGGNAQFRLASGQDSIIDWLRAGLDPLHTDLRLGTVVTSVEWREGSVTVECRSASSKTTERIRASALIVTIPIGVWKAPPDQEGAIRFEPALTSKERALSLLEAGHVVKITFRFRERFWDDPAFLRKRRRGSLDRGLPLNFLHSADRFMPTWWTVAPFRAPVLIGWAGGHAADALLAEGPAALTDRAADALASAWGISRRRLDALLVGTFTHDWQTDPFSRGAYSYAAVGGRDAHAELAKPLRRTLFFAGAATSGDETGTVSGAIESGRRAAREVQRLAKITTSGSTRSPRRRSPR